MKQVIVRLFVCMLVAGAAFTMTVHTKTSEVQPDKMTATPNTPSNKILLNRLIAFSAFLKNSIKHFINGDKN